MFQPRLLQSVTIVRSNVSTLGRRAAGCIADYKTSRMAFEQSLTMVWTHLSGTSAVLPDAEAQSNRIAALHKLFGVCLFDGKLTSERWSCLRTTNSGILRTGG
jgi:hypothetical protein